MICDDSADPIEFSVEELADGSPVTDPANADRFVARSGDAFRFVSEWQCWIAWAETKWIREGAEQKIFRAVVLSAREDYALTRLAIVELEEELRVALLKSKEEAEKVEPRLKWQRQLLKWHETSQNSSRVDATIRQLRAILLLSMSALDAHPHYLNVANGTVDLRSAEMMPHAREHYITQQSPVEWDPDAKCPTWDAFLRTVMGGDALLVLYLQRLVGYSCSGSVEEELLLFLYGSGANGKSTFLNAMKLVMGDYACSAPRGLLMIQKQQQHETEFARLLGKRVATGAEVGDGQRFDEAKIKDLTGRDTIACRRMNEDHWDLYPTHKLWLAGNYKPTIVGVDPAIWRRIRVVPFIITIPVEQRDKSLSEQLRNEAPGILRWAVNGYLEWKRIGLEEPEAVRAATAEYHDESDHLGQFFRETCAFEPAAKIPRAELRESYERWAKESGHEPWGGKKIAARLREHGVVSCDIRTSNGRKVNGWRGVRLAFDATAHEEHLGRDN